MVTNRRRKWRNWGDHPAVVTIGALAGIAGIIAVALAVGRPHVTEPPSPIDDIGIMADIVKRHLLPGGRLSRGLTQAPALSGEEYAAAAAAIRRRASPELKSLLRDPSQVRVVLNADRFVRNYLNEDGRTMVRGNEAAPGTLLLEQ